MSTSSFNVDLFLDRVAADVERHRRVSEIHHRIDEIMKPYGNLVDRCKVIMIPAREYDEAIALLRERRQLLGFDAWLDTVPEGAIELRYYHSSILRGGE